MKTKVKNTKFPTQKTSKGITLVALVITIIVLLILAGVAINMAINSDGLFGKASEATEKWNTAVENERSEIQNVLNVLGVKAPTNFPKEWDSDKVADMVTEKVTINEEEITRNAPIPVGFVASQIPTEDTISEGLVIYEGKDPVTGNANSAEHLAAMTSRNQYVWIPVDDVNYMVMCKLNNANSDKTVCELVLDNGELRCKTHNPTGENTTDLCGRLYEGGSTQTTKVDGKSVYTYIQTINESAWKTQKYDGLWKEPAIVTGDNGDTYDGVDSYLNNIGLVAKDGKTA